MIEDCFDVPFVADLAIREKQIQQNYRPIIAVHKWFARRPGTLFRALLLSEFVEGPLRNSFYRPHALTEKRVADPFMGGGTPLIEANRIGCEVIGYDINPMAYWIVRQEIEHLDLVSYREAANALRRHLEQKVGHLYRTRCMKCSGEAHAKYFLWVKTLSCEKCGNVLDLFPGYLVSEDVRHPLNVMVCAKCGELNECENQGAPGKCSACSAKLSLSGPASRGKCVCVSCNTANRFPRAESGPLGHRLFALEYYCPTCKPSHTGRFFKKPDADDLAKVAEAEAKLKRLDTKYIPDDAIMAGDETDRLHRWGYRRYREMFNTRQLLGLELSCRFIAAQDDVRVRNALSTNLSDLLRYQNLLCRYDTMALKSLDIFSVHGFPVGLIACESNLLGISENGGLSKGSGGWSNIVDKFQKAKAYCDAPFEIRHDGERRVKVPIIGEWIGDERPGLLPESRQVEIRCEDASKAELKPGTLDAVFTDPPYFGSVQYAELMDFCYVWLRRLVPISDPAFKVATTRHVGELTENSNMKRGLDCFADGLGAVLTRMAEALKSGAPLAFTYHHNQLEAYVPVAVGILDAGLIISAAIPCPAEMEASIHINGTGSSIIDTVFVCRSVRNEASQPIPYTPAAMADAVRYDVEQLRSAGVEATSGDIRCITFGHLTRRAVAKLRGKWDRSKPIGARVVIATQCLEEIGRDSILTVMRADDETKNTRKGKPDIASKREKNARGVSV